MPVKTHYIFMLFCLLVIGLMSSPARAEITIDAGVEYTSGDAKLESGNIPIGKGAATYLAPDGVTPILVYPLTTLSFPLNSIMGSVSTDIKVGKLEIFGSIKTNLTHPSKLGEEDERGVAFHDGTGWKYHTINGELVTDLQAKLDLESEVWVYNAKARYLVYSYAPKKNKGATDWYLGVGYERQNYKYDGESKRITTADYVGVWEYPQAGPKRIRYSLVFSIPYLEVGLAGKFGKWTTNANLGYSPMVDAKDDQSNYLGRMAGPYTAKGDYDGNAWLLGLQTAYEFKKHWAISMGVDYRKISVDGTQDVDCVAGVMVAGTDVWSWPADNWRNDAEITSEQYALSLKLGYQF